MRRLWITLAALGALAGCDSGAIGSTCSGGPTETGLCVEGAICAPARSETADPTPAPNGNLSYCRTICDTNADCADQPGFQCREVATSSQHACQPADSTPSDAGT